MSFGMSEQAQSEIVGSRIKALQEANAGLAASNAQLRDALRTFRRANVLAFGSGNFGADALDLFKVADSQAETCLNLTPAQALAELLDNLRTIGVDFLGEMVKEEIAANQNSK